MYEIFTTKEKKIKILLLRIGIMLPKLIPHKPFLKGSQLCKKLLNADINCT